LLHAPLVKWRFFVSCAVLDFKAFGRVLQKQSEKEQCKKVKKSKRLL
jgi:hypothetical protein